MAKRTFKHKNGESLMIDGKLAGAVPSKKNMTPPVVYPSGGGTIAPQADTGVTTDDVHGSWLASRYEDTEHLSLADFDLYLCPLCDGTTTATWCDDCNMDHCETCYNAYGCDGCE